MKTTYYQDEKVLNYVYQCKDTLDLGDTKLTRKDNGKLNLPTGEIVGTDPLTLYDKKPFYIKVAPGQYPCAVYLNDYGIVALLAVFFNDNVAVKWEMALTSASEDLSKLQKGHFYGLGVDAGTASFMDFQTLEVAENIEDDEALFSACDGLEYSNYALKEKDFGGKKNIPFVENLNFAFCKCDDGLYPSYFGYDETGNVCCLVMDMLTLVNENEEN